MRLIPILLASMAIGLSPAMAQTYPSPTYGTITAKTGVALPDGSLVKGVGTGSGTVAAGNDNRITGAIQSSNNLSDLLNAAAARTNLGLGAAATQNVGTTTGTVATGAVVPIALSAVQPGGDVSTNTALGRQLAGAINGSTFYAPAFGSCTWDAAHDVGACIQAAINAAAAAGGGTVEVPAGNYGQTTPLTKSARGVALRGRGVGEGRDAFAPSIFQAVTRLVWIGAPSATMFDEEPAAGSTQSLYASDVEGIVFDCNSIAAVCAKFAQVSHSRINIGVAEPTSIGAYLTTTTTTDAPGTQDNDVWIDARTTNPSSFATDILADGGPGSSWNVSYNRFWRLHAWYNNGDGIVFGNTDNNQFFDLNTYQQPGGTGSNIIFAAQGYVPPNGIPTTGFAYTSRIYHTGSLVTVQGFSSGAKVAAGSGNTGSAAYAPVSLTTNAAVANGSQTLPFSTTASLGPYMNVRCGSGPNSGVINDDSVASVAGGTVQLSYPAIGAAASGTVCKFGFGANVTAKPGAYTISFTSPALANITAPAGGTAQTGVSFAGGLLQAADFTLPLTGTPAAGDTLTVTVPPAATNITAEFLDKANNVPSPHFGIGATGTYTPTTNSFPVQANANGNIGIYFAPEACGGKTPAIGPLAVLIGGCGSNASGSYALSIGGVGNNASGFGASTLGGHNNTATGPYSYAFGEGAVANGAEAAAFGEIVLAAGNYSWARGAYSTDRNRFAFDAFSAGRFSIQGDAQLGTAIVRGSAPLSGSATVTVPVTADGLGASSTNTNNLTANGLHYHMEVSGSCTDSTSTSHIWASWDGAWGDADRKNNDLKYAGAFATATAMSRYDGASNWNTATMQVQGNVSYGLTASFVIPAAAAPAVAGDVPHCVATYRNVQEIQ